LDNIASAYFDNVLIYSDSKEEHVSPVKGIMHLLLEAGLYGKLEEYWFHMKTIGYLGLIVST
jgi:hypothetical protein